MFIKDIVIKIIKLIQGIKINSKRLDNKIKDHNKIEWNWFIRYSKLKFKKK